MLPEIVISGITLDTFSLCVSVAILCAIVLFRRSLIQLGYSRYLYIPIVAVALVAGAIGLPLVAAVDLGGWRTLIDGRALRYGTSFYGGFTFGLAAVLVWARIKRMPLADLFSSASPSLFLGYAIGRLGCLLSGDGCYGTVTNLPWAMSFPKGIRPTGDPVHPAPLYESLLALIAFAIVYRLFRSVQSYADKIRVIALTAFCFGCSRFMVEFVRRNPQHWGLSQAQWISLALIITGIVLLFFAYRQARTNTREYSETVSNVHLGRN